MRAPEVGGVRLTADKVIIATGSRPGVPAIPGIESVPYLTSTTALELEALPEGEIRALLTELADFVVARVA